MQGKIDIIDMQDDKLSLVITKLYTPNNPTYNKIHKNQIIASHQGLH